MLHNVTQRMVVVADGVRGGVSVVPAVSGWLDAGSVRGAAHGRLEARSGRRPEDISLDKAARTQTPQEAWRAPLMPSADASCARYRHTTALALFEPSMLDQATCSLCFACPVHGAVLCQRSTANSGRAATTLAKLVYLFMLGINSARSSCSCTAARMDDKHARPARLGALQGGPESQGPRRRRHEP